MTNYGTDNALVEQMLIAWGMGKLKKKDAAAAIFGNSDDDYTQQQTLFDKTAQDERQHQYRSKALDIELGRAHRGVRYVPEPEPKPRRFKL